MLLTRVDGLINLLERKNVCKSLSVDNCRLEI